MVKHAKKIKKSLTFRPKNVDLALILSTLEIIGNLKAVASESTPVKKGIVTFPEGDFEDFLQSESTPVKKGIVTFTAHVGSSAPSRKAPRLRRGL